MCQCLTYARGTLQNFCFKFDIKWINDAMYATATQQNWSRVLTWPAQLTVVYPIKKFYRGNKCVM